MAVVLDDAFTVPADETPGYSEWAAVGSAAEVDVAVTVSNDQSPDLWVQWTDDTSGPEPDDVDVFSVGIDPNPTRKHYYVHVDNLAVDGAYVRVKGIAYGTEAICHATADAH